jgi:hypothetical protein
MDLGPQHDCASCGFRLSGWKTLPINPDTPDGIRMQFVLTPVVFKEPGTVRARMDKKGTIVKLGSMKMLWGERR